MDKFNKKRYIISLFVTVFGLLALVSGSSYAILKGNTEATSEHIIKAGSVELKLTENFQNIDKSVHALNDVDGLLQTDVYSFSVTNIGSVAAKYDLKLINNASPNSFPDEYVRVGLEVNGKEFGPMGLASVNNVIDSNIIYKDEIINYKLRVWFNKDYVTEMESNSSKSVTLSLRLDAEQSTAIMDENVEAVPRLLSTVGTGGLERIGYSGGSNSQISNSEVFYDYRFSGPDSVVTNNYVYFNCKDVSNQTASTCELYRIIGVFPTDDGTGTITNRIKIIKATSYGKYQYDVMGDNNWKTSVINKEFNEVYWNKISKKYQNIVDDAKYYMGGWGVNTITTPTMFSIERKAANTASETYFYTGRADFTNWVGKIGIMYASDYGFAAPSSCYASTTLVNYSNTGCYDQDWLFQDSTVGEWLFNQQSSDSTRVWRIRETGYAVYYLTGSSTALSVRPVMYLNSDVKFVDGDGSSSNPYKLLK